MDGPSPRCDLPEAAPHVAEPPHRRDRPGRGGGGGRSPGVPASIRVPRAPEDRGRRRGPDRLDGRPPRGPSCPRRSRSSRARSTRASSLSRGAPVPTSPPKSRSSTLDASEPTLALEKLKQNLALKENQQARARLELSGDARLAREPGRDQEAPARDLRRERRAKPQALRRGPRLRGGLPAGEARRRAHAPRARAGRRDAGSRGAVRRRSGGGPPPRDGHAQEGSPGGRAPDPVRDRDGPRDRASSRGSCPTPERACGAATRSRGSRTSRRTGSRRRWPTCTRRSSARACRRFATVNGVKLTGTVARVLPTVQNGAISVEIALDDRSNPVLKPSLRAEVELVLDRKEKALRIARGRVPGERSRAGRLRRAAGTSRSSRR